MYYRLDKLIFLIYNCEIQLTVLGASYMSSLQLGIKYGAIYQMKGEKYNYIFHKWYMPFIRQINLMYGKCIAMKKRKLNYVIHNPNTIEKTLQALQVASNVNNKQLQEKI